MSPPAAPPELTPVKQALLKIQALREEIAQLKQSGAHEPIAVVGIGCRFPGGVESEADLWRMVEDRVDAVTTVPPDRWSDALYDPEPGTPGKTYCRHGAFLDGVDQFDPAFFGVSPRDAAQMDPQHRLLLQCTWRALEDAGFNRSTIKAQRTGVFVGSCLDDYARLSEAVQSDGDGAIYAQTSLGTARAIAAGRVSYLFGFHGPTLQLDTACSSSLVATHLACQALRQGEADVALAGGVNLILTPEMTCGLSELGALSPSGRCSTFDAGDIVLAAF